MVASGQKQRNGVILQRSILLSIVLFSILKTNAMGQEVGGMNSLNLTSLDQLRLQLFTHYNRNAQPTTYRNEPTNITMGLSINYLDVDEINGKITLHAWLKLRWMDEGRSWDPREFDNITEIHLKQNEVWKPDIMLFNSVGQGSASIGGDTQVLLEHKGQFMWVPPAVYTSYCKLDLRMWPYDTQRCTLKIGTWSMTRIDAKYLTSKESLDYMEFIQSTEWTILSGSMKLYPKDYYNYVEYSFVMQRRSTMYGVVIFTPAYCIVLLTLATFWIPPQMSEKILLNGIIVMTIASFLMYFAQLLPILAENTPLIVLFYSSCLLAISISTIIAVAVIYISTAKHKRRVPESIRTILNGTAGNVLCLKQFCFETGSQAILNNGTKELNEHIYDVTENDASDSLVNDPPSKHSMQFDWVLLATAVDRICFLCYCVVFIILGVVYSIFV